MYSLAIPIMEIRTYVTHYLPNGKLREIFQVYKPPLLLLKLQTWLILVNQIWLSLFNS